MTKTSGRRRWAGVVLIISGALLIGLPLALHACSTETGARPLGNAPPLSATEVGVVRRSRVAVAALPQALALVPAAMIDGAALAKPQAPALTQAGAIQLLSQPSLLALRQAVQDPGPLATPLSRALTAADSSTRPARFPSIGLLLVLFGLPGVVALMAGALLLLSGPGRPSPVPRILPTACLLAAVWLIVTAFLPIIPGGRSVWSNALRGRQESHQLSIPLGPGEPAVSSPGATTTMQANLNVLQGVYADIVPAIEAGATSVGGTLSDSDAVSVIGTDARLAPLKQLILGLSGIYGAGILSVQAAASAEATAPSRHASTYLPLVGVPLALVLTGAALLAVAPRSRRPTREWDAAPVTSHRLRMQW
jgi:hypothetical protein